MLPIIGSIIMTVLNNLHTVKESKSRLELNFPLIVNVKIPSKKRKTKKQ